MTRKRYTSDDILAYIRRYRRCHHSSPARTDISAGLNIHFSTACHHVSQLVKRNLVEVVGPRRLIKVLDAEVPVVRLGGIDATERVTDPSRTLATVPPAVANEFEPHPAMFALVSDHSLDAAGLHPGDRVAVTRIDSDTPASGCIVLARWKGELVLRRYRKPTRRTIALEPESHDPNHRTITTTTTDPNLTLEGKVIGALVSCADRKSP